MVVAWLHTGFHLPFPTPISQLPQYSLPCYSPNMPNTRLSHGVCIRWNAAPPDIHPGMARSLTARSPVPAEAFLTANLNMHPSLSNPHPALLSHSAT